MTRKKLLFVFGTRPEAIKMAPLVKYFSGNKKEFITKVCVTAQHRQMLDEVLKVFRIKPDHDLNIMQDGQTLYHITSSALTRMQTVLEKERPDMVMVHGDTTTTFAASLAAFYQKVPVAHVEAGLRSYDRHHPFPEEANRLLTDDLCDLYLAPTETAKRALLKENIKAPDIFVTGNTVIDALYSVLKTSKGFSDPSLRKLFRSGPGRFILVTAHRRENFGRPMENAFFAMKRIALEFPELGIIYPVHLNPNVREPADRILGGIPNVHLLPPLCYPDLASLIARSSFVVTDSGGLQEEAPSLGKPVLVLREVTERPEAVSSGTVRIIGTDEKRVYSEIKRLITDKKAHAAMARSVSPYGDGKAAARTMEAVRFYFGIRRTRPEDFRFSSRGHKDVPKK